MILYRNCGGIGPRLERMDMGIVRMCSPGALSNRLLRSEYPTSPTSTTVEFQSSLLVRYHRLFPPLSMSSSPASPCSFSPTFVSVLAYTGRYRIGRDYRYCPESVSVYYVSIVCHECLIHLNLKFDERKNSHVGSAKVCKSAIHPCCSNYQNGQSGSLKHLCCRRHIKSEAFTTRKKSKDIRDLRGLAF